MDSQQIQLSMLDKRECLVGFVSYSGGLMFKPRPAILA